MKNKYSPISDSDDSSKTLNDEKADSRSSPSDGTPPPYTASSKFIDLEMADGSAQNSAQDTVNNTRSSSMDKWQIIMYLLFSTSFAYIAAYAVLPVLFFGLKVSVNAQAFWWLFGSFFVVLGLFLFATHMLYLGLFTQAGRATKKYIKKGGGAPAVCKDLITLIIFNGVGGGALKLSGSFEFIHSAAVLMVLAVLNICLFVLLIRNPDVIEDIQDMTRVNRISRNGPPRNEEIELQPLAEQRADV
ncbi:wtf meiotic driver [Schizosaccharomyces osmophilus]|uniref:Wtf meiotic driver n=1 Tax=Schizosaccharomyces osmophilus TaxID=2545709 RepID=A0AAF0AYG2_9SCHI|nr:wtf meiotic driver [Schizosaccharomyces osmophilus]WBW74990.1 wtf meiotic driver [Schizosaccharomyces osmophilus]